MNLLIWFTTYCQLLCFDSLSVWLRIKKGAGAEASTALRPHRCLRASATRPALEIRLPCVEVPFAPVFTKSTKLCTQDMRRRLRPSLDEEGKYLWRYWWTVKWWICVWLSITTFYTTLELLSPGSVGYWRSCFNTSGRWSVCFMYFLSPWQNDECSSFLYGKDWLLCIVVLCVTLSSLVIAV